MPGSIGSSEHPPKDKDDYHAATLARPRDLGPDQKPRFVASGEGKERGYEDSSPLRPQPPLQLGPLCPSVSPAIMAESDFSRPCTIGYGYSLRPHKRRTADIPTSQHGFAIDFSTKARQTSLRRRREQVNQFKKPSTRAMINSASSRSSQAVPRQAMCWSGRTSRSRRAVNRDEIRLIEPQHVERQRRAVLRPRQALCSVACRRRPA